MKEKTNQELEDQLLKEFNEMIEKKEDRIISARISEDDYFFVKNKGWKFVYVFQIGLEFLKRNFKK